MSVVTAGVGADRTGATVTSAQSLSMEPETMVVSINLASSTWAAIHRYGHFCVNVLGADQRDVAGAQRQHHVARPGELDQRGEPAEFLERAVRHRPLVPQSSGIRDPEARKLQPR